MLIGYREYKHQRKLRAFQGDDVLCLICNTRFSKFAPFGRGSRQNAKCHHCGSLERHRLQWKYLHEQTTLFTNPTRIRLLHFAPERAFYNAFSANMHIEYYPCDLTPERYANFGSVKILQADITKLPFEANFFDVVICNHVLEHIPDDSRAMDEVLRVMKNGAWGIFQVPIDRNRDVTYEDPSINTPEARLRAFGQSDHVRYYGRDYPQRLEKAGFTVTTDDYANTFSPEQAFIYGINRGEILHVCRKEGK